MSSLGRSDDEELTGVDAVMAAINAIKEDDDDLSIREIIKSTMITTRINSLNNSENDDRKIFTELINHFIYIHEVLLILAKVWGNDENMEGRVLGLLISHADNMDQVYDVLYKMKWDFNNVLRASGKIPDMTIIEIAHNLNEYDVSSILKDAKFKWGIERLAKAMDESKIWKNKDLIVNLMQILEMKRLEIQGVLEKIGWDAQKIDEYFKMFERDLLSDDLGFSPNEPGDEEKIDGDNDDENVNGDVDIVNTIEMDCEGNDPRVIEGLMDEMDGDAKRIIRALLDTDKWDIPRIREAIQNGNLDDAQSLTDALEAHEG